MNVSTLENVIRQYVHLEPPTNKGWCAVLCKVCNDRGHKGKRAAFRFEGENVAYHCFNCGIKPTYDPERHDIMPKEMKKVLRDFGIPDEEWQQVIFNNMTVERKERKKKHIAELKSIEPDEIPLPKEFYLLSNAKQNDNWAIIATDYLLENRKLDPTSYPFMLSHFTNLPHLKKWMGRLIIPIYKDKKLIYYMGRDLTGSKIKKYESPTIPKNKILFGYEKLFIQTDEPLYVVEGIFDAMSINNGIAINGRTLTTQQYAHLNRSPRKKIYIPDRFGNGDEGALQALSFGWEVSFPDIGGCKDMNEAVKKYGKLYVMKTLIDNTLSNVAAETRIGIYCE
jgi:DNA primase